ncbi:class I SAM-dependent methyltransferase [Paenibacillus methanolicus]|uniref:Methyltransferase family protein n=1 Tax=Paenibacillus methanolicus TaxID=582686 RepID=A0A5S5C6M7_9BACL|nr:class I SAM-dependent methyltransferase [Paenibacillus methanolicus]TYP74819.1 methyltransferase family protein [Paenibacillus methanolicus]
MSEYFWDGQIEYLRNTRGLYYNDDYLAFLIQSVWKINRPVRVVDFGCGYGFLAAKLMPLLPAGSSYIGIDAGPRLIGQARELFRDAPFAAAFIEGDLTTMDVDRAYDLAVCHAFLLHMEDPLAMLRKMVDCLEDGGRIACFEPHWIANMANYHVDGHPLSEVVQLGVLQKLFERDAARGGRDGNIGLKLPVYLSELGVRDIDCRVSDKVNFLNPAEDAGRADALFNALKEEGIGADPGEADAYLANLTGRGITEEEAMRGYRAELLLSQAFSRESALVYAPNMKITSGVVRRSNEALAGE